MRFTHPSTTNRRALSSVLLVLSLLAALIIPSSANALEAKPITTNSVSSTETDRAGANHLRLEASEPLAERDAGVPPGPSGAQCITYPRQDDSPSSFSAAAIDLRTPSLTNHFWGQYAPTGSFDAVVPPGYLTSGTVESLVYHDIFVWYAGNLHAWSVPNDPFYSPPNYIGADPWVASGSGDIEVCATYHFIYVDNAELQGFGLLGDFRVDNATKLATVPLPENDAHFTRFLRYVGRYSDLDECLNYEVAPAPASVPNLLELQNTDAGFCFLVFEDDNYWSSWSEQFIEPLTPPPPGSFESPSYIGADLTLDEYNVAVHSNLDHLGIELQADGSYTCWGQPATQTGTNLSETIHGTPGNDIIVALGGDDTIFGGGGHDRICGGDGLDTIWGGDGQDFIHGGDNRDHIYGDGSSDILVGGDGNDRIRGGARLDKIHGGDGEDDITGDENDDTIWAGAGNDYIEGNAGKDTIYGGSEYDRARGGTARDTCAGDVEWTRSC